MSANLSMKKSLFGLKPAEVQSYMDTVSRDIEEKLTLKDEEIEELKQKNQTLDNEINNLKVQVDKATKEKERISEAFLKAENSANEIMLSARREADTLLETAKLKAEQILRAAERQAADYQTKMERELAAQKMELEAHKREVFVLRENSVRTLEKFDETLGKIVES